MMQDHLTTRRVFLQRGLAILAATATVPLFLDQTVMALDNPQDAPLTQRPSGTDGKILVVVQLSGGNDGLSMVVPYGDDAYYRARPAIALDAKSVLKIDDYIGLNPQLAPLKSLFDDGRLAIVQGVGYPNPNRSHFRSMDIWQTAEPERQFETSGWLGRYFDNTCSGTDPRAGVAIGDALPLAMQGQRIIPLSFERPESYQYRGPDRARYQLLNEAPADSSSPAIEPPGPVTASAQLDFLHRVAMDAQLSSDQILGVTRAHSPTGEYPRNPFGAALHTVAAMIAGGLPTRVYYVSLGGFDTHAGQRGRHDQLMTQLGQGLAAFMADLKEQRNDDRVVVMTFSEFGRRVQQNASNGTDHGAAAPMLVLGKSVNPGLVGRHPSLTDLDQGDLRFAIDFRSVYNTLLENWLETPGQPILGQTFNRLPILHG